jgi:2-oxoglutarate ferredoxin oxidoreductase subunit beta
VAEGIKMVNPDKTVFVVSGDGDLLSIGFSHLIHAARRNAPLKVICVNNSIYGMTGGQSSPTTSTGLKTKSYPGGTPYTPLSAKNILESIDDIYYRQVKGYDLNGFEQAVEEVINYQGFGFVEVMTVCITNDPRTKKEKDKLEVAREILK